MRLLYTLFIGFLFSVNMSSTLEVLELSFLPESSLVIKGKSNVNHFSCNYNTYLLTDSIAVVYEKVNNKLVFKDACLSLSSSLFDCGVKGINRDFQKLLKTSQYPMIQMSLTDVELSDKKKDSVMTSLLFTICNVSKKYNTSIAFNKKNDVVEFKGSICLDIEDFELKPPKKVLGLIKVNKSIDVDFHFLTRIKKEQ